MKTIKNQLLISALCIAVLSFGLVSSVNAALEKRLGGLAYYDTELDISWAVTRAHINTSGGTWSDQRTWASNLAVGGVTGWRLPSADVNGDQQTGSADGICFVCADNELGYLFHQEGITPSTPGVFIDILDELGRDVLWTDTEYLSLPEFAFQFVFLDGYIDIRHKESGLASWAVHDGDVGVGVGTVSVPGTIALMGMGLAGLLGSRRS